MSRWIHGRQKVLSGAVATVLLVPAGFVSLPSSPEVSPSAITKDRPIERALPTPDGGGEANRSPGPQGPSGWPVQGSTAVSPVPPELRESLSKMPAVPDWDPAGWLRPVNDASPGSVCLATDNDLPYEPPDASYSTSLLGPAPGYYEVAGPSGSLEGESPVGVMMLIHGGGWFIAGPPAAYSMRGQADAWRERGWSVVNVTSREACGAWVGDMLWFYDRVRSVVGSQLPICVTGRSSGGHLALMVAAHRHNVECVIAEAAPTDLVSIVDQGTDKHAEGTRLVQGWARAAFGDDLRAHSPMGFVNRIRARTLVSVASDDLLIPSAQATELVAALQAAYPDRMHNALILEPGNWPWVHTRVSTDSFVEHAWAAWFTAVGV